jgi:hypothetical protein
MVLSPEVSTLRVQTAAHQLQPQAPVGLNQLPQTVNESSVTSATSSATISSRAPPSQANGKTLRRN